MFLSTASWGPTKTNSSRTSRGRVCSPIMVAMGPSDGQGGALSSSQGLGIHNPEVSAETMSLVTSLPHLVLVLLQTTRTGTPPWQGFFPHFPPCYSSCIRGPLIHRGYFPRPAMETGNHSEGRALCSSATAKSPDSPSVSVDWEAGAALVALQGSGGCYFLAGDCFTQTRKL